VIRSRRLTCQSKDRRLSHDEIRRLGKALRDLAEAGENPTSLSAIELIALTGFRRSEARLLESTWVAEDYRSIRFPDTKTGRQTGIVGQAATEVIKRQQKHRRSKYVFPADFTDGAFVGLPRVLSRVLKKVEIEGISLHMVRHTFASIAAELDFSELTIAGLLEHASRGVTQRYIHIDEALVLAANKVSERISLLLQQNDKAKLNNGLELSV
jgi:integrase